MTLKLRGLLKVFGLVALAAGPVACRHHDHDEAQAASHARAEEADHHESEGQGEEQGHSWVTRGPHGEAILKLDDETRARVGLVVREAPAATRVQEIVAPGMLEEDPGQSFTVRATVTGFLRSIPDRDWPVIGARLEAGAAIGVVEPRLSALERAELRQRWMDARADEEALRAELVAARLAYEKSRTLNAENKLVSDQTLAEEEAKVRSHEARLEAAAKRSQILEQQLNESASSAEAFTLIAPHAADVVEILSRPGEAVESGQPVLRLACFDQLLARVELPIGQAPPPPSAPAKIVEVNHPDVVLPASFVAPAATAGMHLRGPALLYRVDAAGNSLRPGGFVTAYLGTLGPSISGVIVPRSAVLRYAGANWVYVESAEATFTRRRIELLSPETAGWFVSHGVGPGGKIVVTGAQVLLSEELKAQIELEAEAEE